MQYSVILLIVLYVTSSGRILFFNWKFVPLTPFTHLTPSPPSAIGNHQSVKEGIF